jgi:hypothetical protein
MQLDQMGLSRGSGEPCDRLVELPAFQPVRAEESGAEPAAQIAGLIKVPFPGARSATV